MRFPNKAKLIAFKEFPLLGTTTVIKVINWPDPTKGQAKGRLHTVWASALEVLDS
jgi:hypothetical protein